MADQLDMAPDAWSLPHPEFRYALAKYFQSVSRGEDTGPLVMSLAAYVDTFATGAAFTDAWERQEERIAEQGSRLDHQIDADNLARFRLVLRGAREGGLFEGPDDFGKRQREAGLNRVRGRPAP